MDTTAKAWTGDDMVQLIMDPSVLSSWCERVDDSVLDQMFSISRSLYYAIHVKRSALLDCPK